MMQAPPQTTCERLRWAEEERATSREDDFISLVERQARFVFCVAYSVVRNVTDAEDVVQETFLKLYKNRAWEGIKDERAFLARTAWRIAVDRLPRKSAELSEATALTEDSNPEQEAIAADWNSTIHRLIDGLPDELRLPLGLSTVEEMNSREISEVMGIPEGTVRTRLMRAREILKKKLEAMGVNRSG